jgi:hypothetical protein
MKGTVFSPYINREPDEGYGLQPVPNPAKIKAGFSRRGMHFDLGNQMKGTGFSPYIKRPI